MTFYLAWAPAEETVWGAHLKRDDEDVVSFELRHSEGDFPTLLVEIRNPRTSRLHPPGQDVWAWFSIDDRPLFFGRLVAVPEDLHHELVRFNFIARPVDYETTRRSLAETLKVAPFWDPVWVKAELVEDPDVVLEARSAVWHVDRVTHALTISDINVGEDGTVVLGEADYFYESLAVRYGSTPLRRVRVEAEIGWDQRASGEVDITRQIVAAGGGSHTLASLTGQGLEQDWPEAETSLGGGWSVAAVDLRRADGASLPSRFMDVGVMSLKPKDDDEGSKAEAFLAPAYSARFYAWEFHPKMVLGYEVDRSRTERINFNLDADVQAIVTEPGDADVEVITIASRRVSEPLSEGEVPPIEDPGRRSYVNTDRGRRSLEYLIMLARATLLARARAVEASIEVPIEAGMDLSCRKNVQINDYRLPGGALSGKVVEYALIADGAGSQRAEITVASTAGYGGAVLPADGSPVYVDDYSGGYQISTGAMIAPSGGDLAYEDISAVPITDDGLDFTQDLPPSSVIRKLEVTNAEAAQRAVMSKVFPDIPAAIEALNEVHTVVCLELVPLDTGPYETVFEVGVSPLHVPQMVTL